MTPEKIQELTALDAKIAEAVIALDAAYTALKEAIRAYTENVKTIS